MWTVKLSHQSYIYIFKEISQHRRHNDTYITSSNSGTYLPFGKLFQILFLFGLDIRKANAFTYLGSLNSESYDDDDWKYTLVLCCVMAHTCYIKCVMLWVFKNRFAVASEQKMIHLRKWKYELEKHCLLLILRFTHCVVWLNEKKSILNRNCHLKS